MARSRSHVVSNGLQRFFADGKQVQLIDKVARPGERRVRLVGTRDAFVREHFSSHLVDGRYVDELEDAWSKIEDEALPAVRAWLQGTPIPAGWSSVGSREATKILAALHFARSYAYRELHDRAAEEMRQQAIADFPTEPEFVRAWRRELGIEPTAEAVAQIVDERFAASVGPHSPFAIRQMARYYNLALDHLEPLYVQAVRPRREALHFVDSPLVVARADGSVVGARVLALKGANRLFLPIAPNLAAVFTSVPEDDVVEAEDYLVQGLNHFTWRAAGSQILASPATNLDLALARTGWRPKVGCNQPCFCGSGRKSKQCCGA